MTVLPVWAFMVCSRAKFYIVERVMEDGGFLNRIVASIIQSYVAFLKYEISSR
jgi:hypothetical protein